ncbi:hypothetical protein [Nesterenkonia sp.]|uniref:hypothetical protein n=1 Tax=Nesterenkonia sp. TaxID=704201 RepID=UPI002624DD9D|nr:hypothetical protein [Nesterenkonia sp.]
MIQPRGHHARSVPAQAQDLGRLGVDLLGKPLRVEPVMQDRRVLPEELIEREVGINVDRGESDETFGFGAEQHVRTDEDRIAEADRLVPELAKHDRGPGPDEHDLETVVEQRPDWAMERARRSNQRSKPSRTTGVSGGLENRRTLLLGCL